MNNKMKAGTEIIAPTKYAYIDIAKAIGILAVVFAHINVEGLLYQTLYSFHIPLFFIISGMTFKHENVGFRDFIHKKATRLLLPYLIYSLITFAWYVLVEVKMPEFTALTRGQTASGAFMEIFLCRGSVDFLQHNPALWFIPCLFITELIYYTLCKCGKLVKIIAGLALGVFGYLFTLDYMPQLFRELPWQAGVAFVAIPFMMFGQWIAQAKGLDGLQKLVTKKKVLSWILVVVAIAAVIVLTKVNALFLPEEAKGHISMGTKHLGNIGIFYFNAILGTCMVLALSALLADIFKERIELHKSGLVWLGERSYAIMAIHFPVKRRMVVLVAQAISAWNLADVDGGFTTYTSSRVLPSFVAFVITIIITIIITISAENFSNRATLPGKKKA